MSIRFIDFAACVSFGLAAGALGQPALPESERGSSLGESDWTIVVINLRYADAEEIVHVLKELLPRTFKVVAYHPTNSVLISGDRTVIEDIEKRGFKEAR